MNHSNLLQSGKISHLSLKNRIIMAPMGSNLAEADGHCGQRLIRYYEERAKGGVGLIIVETTTISWPAGATMPNQIGLSNERFLPSLRELVQRVKKYNTKIAIQLNHGGKVSGEDSAQGFPQLVPSEPKKSKSGIFSALTKPELSTFFRSAGPDGKGPTYEVLTEERIQQMVQQYAQAAKLVKKAGFDAIEIHAGHGYLLASFLSPASNQRTDQYGGSFENRTRFLVEVIKAVKQATGEEFPIICRLDAMEYRVENGITIEDSINLAKLLEQNGVNAIDVSAYANVNSDIGFTEAPIVHKPAGFTPFAKAIKKAVGIPIIAVGRIEADVANKMIGNGDFDFVAMGRKLLAEPMLPNKLIASDSDSIRPCIYCYVCVSNILLSKPVTCAVNPDVGKESNIPQPQVKKVLIIGGGPAGMEAALTCAQLGHRVTLWEQEASLGGTLKVAGLAYLPNEKLMDFLISRIKQSNVTVTLKKHATIDAVKKENPDVVLTAVGANRQAPDLQGKELPHVFDGNELRGLLFGSKGATAKLPLLSKTAVTLARILGITRHIGLLRKLSHLYMPVGKQVCIVGGGLVGLEVAELLVERGRQVTVLEPSRTLGAELSVYRRWRVLYLLRKHHAALYTKVENIHIDKTHLTYELDGVTQKIPADSVIIAQGAEPDLSLTSQLQQANIKAIAIGDCHDVGYIEGAIKSAREAARTV